MSVIYTVLSSYCGENMPLTHGSSYCDSIYCLKIHRCLEIGTSILTVRAVTARDKFVDKFKL